MSKKIVRVYSADECADINFKQIGKLEHVETLNADDILLVVDKNGNGNINNVEIRELAEFFSKVNVNAQWYLPKVDGSVISFEWSELTSNHPEPIDILDLIPIATEERAGLISAENIAKLNSLRPYKVDGKTIIANSDNVISAVGGTPISTKVTLTASGWDIDLKTQKIQISINTENRNVIDVPSEYIQVVSQHHILAIREETDGITFQCDSIPGVDISIYITSMAVVKC